MKTASPSENSHDVMDERKRKRMQSNRESARRSRMRKQKHLDDLTAQIAQISEENNEILKRINVTTQQYVKMEGEKSVRRAEMMEFSQRLEALNRILSHTAAASATADCMFEADEFSFDDCFLMGVNHQPIMAAAAEIIYHCC